MKLRAISGFGVKGPACFLLELAGRRFLLDCGLGPDNDAQPNLNDIGPLDAGLISHSHRDHTGSLDLLQKHGNPPVFATGLTGKFAGFTAKSDLPLLGTTTIAGLDIRTGRAGHAPGGIFMRIGGPDGLLYTGDWSAEGPLFTRDPWPRARALLFDASYGAYDAPLNDGFEALNRLAQSTPLLLPAPAGGRGLDMAVMLGEAGHEVRLCSVHRAVAALLLESGTDLDDRRSDRLATLLSTSRELTADAQPSGIMIAAKADAASGMAATLASRWANSNDVTIVFTGHIAASTPAEALVRSNRARFIRWNVHPRLRDTVALLDAVQPEIAMPAFLPADQLDRLAIALPGVPLTRHAEFTLQERHASVTAND